VQAAAPIGVRARAEPHLQLIAVQNRVAVLQLKPVAAHTRCMGEDTLRGTHHASGRDSVELCDGLAATQRAQPSRPRQSCASPCSQPV
jgi:hypothetical protein